MTPTTKAPKAPQTPSIAPTRQSAPSSDPSASESLQSGAVVPSPPSLIDRLAGSRYLGISAVVFAALQAICPALVAISAVRVLIGLAALTAAGTELSGSVWHADWIRIPMMAIAGGGALLNLFVIWQVRRLRNRPAAQWRVSPATRGKMRSEWLQIALAVLTFILIAAEIHYHHGS